MVAIGVGGADAVDVMTGMEWEWELKIISPKANEIKELYYKGAYTKDSVKCDVVGIVDNNEIILNINDELHSIHPDYLLDMQKKERFIIVDIETPRSFSPADGIREVAAVVVEDYRVIDTLHLAIITDEEKYKNGYDCLLHLLLFLKQMDFHLHIQLLEL